MDFFSWTNFNNSYLQSAVKNESVFDNSSSCFKNFLFGVSCFDKFNKTIWWNLSIESFMSEVYEIGICKFFIYCNIMSYYFFTNKKQQIRPYSKHTSSVFISSFSHRDNQE